MSEPSTDPVEGGAKREGSGRRTRSRTISRDELFAPITPAAVEQPKSLVNSVGLSFVLLPAGSFEMGSPPTEAGHRTNEGPVHEVVVTQPIYMSIYPITQRAYLAVTGQNPAKFTIDNGGGLDHPVENVTWMDADAFCRKLSARPEERAAGRNYRLPTEAEWEYAARAGKRASPFGHGLTLSADVGNFDWSHPYGDHPPADASTGTTPVDRYPSNAWGLYDTHGNVWEWCADWYGEAYYRTAPPRDPAGPPTGRFRILRGGSWRNHGNACRAAYRNALAPHARDSATGFRVVLTISGT